MSTFIKDIMSTSNSCEAMPDLAEKFGFASYFDHLLKTKTSVDVTFIMETPDGDVEFSAHQMVLAMRSAYFADMFYGDQKEKENMVIRLKKVNPKAFEDMTRYCYDCKPGLETLEEICTLFRVAQEFKVLSLMNLCRSYLLDIDVMPGNVFSLLEISECMGDKTLKDRCYIFLQEKTKDVMEMQEMAHVPPAMVHIILDLPKLSLNSEMELITWLFDWANVKVEEGEAVCRNAREYLQNLLHDMNFLALTFEEFAKLCKDFPDFFTSEEVASICLNIASPGTREMPDWYRKGGKIREYERLRTKLINEHIDEGDKSATDILVLEVILRCSTEFLKWFSERNEVDESWRVDYIEDPFFYYMILKHFKLCYKIVHQLSKMIDKREILGTSEIPEESIQKVFYFCTCLSLTLECDTLECFLENENDRVLKEIFGDDGLERLKKKLENEEEVRELEKCLRDIKEGMKKALENDEENERMKNMLDNIEELEIDKLLENMDKMYKSSKECESLNEFSKEMRFLVIERIGKLCEDYYKILMEIKPFCQEILMELNT